MTVVRPATDDDWPRIHPFFAEVVEAGDSYAFPLGMTAEQARPWWMEEPPGRTFVAVEGDTVLGSAKSGPNRPGRGAHVATASFMVDPAHRGLGVARRLAEHVLAWAGDEGYRSMQFNAVVETNTAAVGLWLDLGFTVIGTVPAAYDHRVHGLVGLHVMHRQLG